MSGLKEVALGLIVKPITAVANRAEWIINNPYQTGRHVARSTQWGTLFRKGYRESAKFSRLLKRMYPETGESSELSVPRIDGLSDVEIDLLLQNSLNQEHIAAFFEDWFCTSGHLDSLAREFLQPESDLPEALAILYDAIDIDDEKYLMCAPLAAANLVMSKESVSDCTRRFNRMFTRKIELGEIGWATELSSEFPDILDRRVFSKVPDEYLHSSKISLENPELKANIKKMLAVSMTENKAEFFYAGEGGTKVVRVNESGIFATDIEDFNDLVFNPWIRLMAILMHKSLKISSTFPIVELSLVLMESIALDPDGIRMNASKGEGGTPRCHLSTERHKLDSSIKLLILLMYMSRSIRRVSQSFARREQQHSRALLGLTLKEIKEERPMPKYSYERRNEALEKIRNELNRLDVRAVLSSLTTTTSVTRTPATSQPFGTDGALDSVSEDLMKAMRKEVGRVQMEFSWNSQKRDVLDISGSLWLDRIAKGKLLTAKRSQELTKFNKRKHVPQEMLSKREVSFYLPLYNNTVVFPEKEDVTNLRYRRLQIGSESDLTSVVSVLVATILWADGQECGAVEAAISADKNGTQELIEFTDGALGAELRNMLVAKGESELKITNLVSCVHSELAGPRDSDWVVREVLSLAVRHGIVCTRESARTGAYLKVMETVRSSNSDLHRLIYADSPVSLKGVMVRQVSEFNKKGLEFIIVDELLDEAFEVTIQPKPGSTEESVSNALSPKGQREASIVVHIEADRRRHRKVNSSKYCTLSRGMTCQ